MSYQEYHEGRTMLPGIFQAFAGNLDSAAQSANPWAKAMAATQIEMMGLASRRAQALLEVPTRLSTCRTPQDLVSEQMRFWQTCMHQYADTNRKVCAAWAAVAPAMGAGVQAMWANGTRETMAQAQRMERDYITFPEPKEPAAGTAQVTPVRPGSSASRRVA